MNAPESQGPLHGIVVLDASRMLPGAVLARTLLDLGARVIKVEDPKIGDPMRHAPPQRGGVGVGFAVHYRGAESIELDLRSDRDAAILRRLIQHADVLVESFRPGKLDQWGVGPVALRNANPRLIVCSIPGFAADDGDPQNVGHDMNFVGSSGLLARLPSVAVPRMQFADVSTGLLAATAITSALLERARTGSGRHVIQPIAAGPLPFLTWAWADAEAGATGQESMCDGIIGGGCAAYSIYRCADGRDLVVGCLEPKFWITFCARVGRSDLASAGLRTGPDGATTIAAMAETLATRSTQQWMDAIAEDNLPVTVVQTLADARVDARFAPLLEHAPMADGTHLHVPGPAVRVGSTPSAPPPRLGEHTLSVLRGFGFSDREIEGLH